MCRRGAGAWNALANAHPWLTAAEPDVEALLARRQGPEYLCLVVPVDACYELVGRIRTHWSGLGGGDRVRAEIDAFFAGALRRAEGPTDREPAGTHPCGAQP